jgi:carbon storage regulator CsrA
MLNLVLSRKKNESILIDNDITVTVVEIREDKVRLGFVSPKDIPVHRQEVFDAIHGKVTVPPPLFEPKESDQGSMYNRFTDRARKVMQLANQEAMRFKHEYIGTEHILLGLVREGSGVGANVLKNLDIDLVKIRREVETIIQAGPDMLTMGKLPQTPRAKKVIEYAIAEARNLNHHYVGTEHLLVGLVREEEGVAAQVLMNLGLRLQDIREEVLNLLGAHLPQGVTEDHYKILRALFPDKPEDRLAHEPGFQHLPEEVRLVVGTFDQLIDQLRILKEEAVAEQDFDKAANLRDQHDRIRKIRESFIRLWNKPP